RARAADPLVPRPLEVEAGGIRDDAPRAARGRALRLRLLRRALGGGALRLEAAEGPARPPPAEDGRDLHRPRAPLVDRARAGPRGAHGLPRLPMGDRARARVPRD